MRHRHRICAARFIIYNSCPHVCVFIVQRIFFYYYYSSHISDLACEHNTWGLRKKKNPVKIRLIIYNGDRTPRNFQL